MTTERIPAGRVVASGGCSPRQRPAVLPGFVQCPFVAGVFKAASLPLGTGRASELGHEQ